MPTSVVQVGVVKMSVQSTLPIGIDMTNFLAAVEGSTIADTFANLVDTPTDTPVEGFVSAPSTTDNVVTQDIVGSLLDPSIQYDLFIGFTGASGFTPVASVHIIPGP